MPDDSAPRGVVLLTGATGFIGQRLQDCLLQEGYSVRALVRHGSPRLANLDPRVERIEGELDNTQALAGARAGTRAVVHCAGVVRGRNWDDFAGVNVEGVRHIAQAMKRLSNPPALLYMSSLAASEPELSDYARSKREGERVLEEYSDLLWTVFRPPALYGPGDAEMRPLLKLIRRGVVLVPGGDKDRRVSLMHVDDLCGAVAAWLQAPARHRQYRYEIDDGHDGGYSYRQITEAVCARPILRGPLYVPLPAAVLHVVARVNEVATRLIRRAPMLTRGKVREVTHPDWRCDNTAFARTSGWSPRIKLADGAADLFEGS